jgi:hypothetical protein
MPSPPKETMAERMARIRRELNKAAARQYKKEQQALLNAEAKKAKRAAKVAKEAQIPCKSCNKVQAECFCNGWHRSAEEKAEEQKARAAKGAKEPKVRLTPEQRERLEHLTVLGLTLAQDTVADIKKAYRALALLHHPDKQGDQEVMKAINASHDFLVA